MLIIVGNIFGFYSINPVHMYMPVLYIVVPPTDDGERLY